MKINRTLLKLGLTVVTASILAGCSAPAPDVTARQDQYGVAVDETTANYDTFGRRWGQTPVTETKVVEAPAAPAKPAPAAPGCASSVRTGLVDLSKTAPAEASLGAEYECTITAHANVCAGNVVITDRLPAGASYVSSTPAATVDGDKLVWKVGDMDAGQTLTAKVVLRADKEGSLVNCALIAADPRVCVATFVGKPSLTIDKSGPEVAKLGDNVTYNIVVKNTGNAVAKNVVVSDTVPEGLSHASGQRDLAFNVGDLAPGQSKPLSVTLKADKRGKVCNTAVANSSNAGKVSDDACTLIQQPGLKIEKSGTKEQIVGRKASYEVVVFNTGDTTLSDVTVTDNAPEGTVISSAEGASVSGNTATWHTSLAAGEKKTYNVVLVGKTAGNHCNAASASASGLSDSTQACTLWKGVPAVLLEVVDDPDPIQVGESTTYTIKVTNQGFADLHNVKIVANYDEETTPTATAQGSISGKEVNFPVVSVLPAKQVITYTITVKGDKVGDSRNKVVLTCDEITKPVDETESTTVY
jgi:uncharacterized repeat protein (TIGR01451 family)